MVPIPNSEALRHRSIAHKQLGLIFTLMVYVPFMFFVLFLVHTLVDVAHSPKHWPKQRSRGACLPGAGEEGEMLEREMGRSCWTF